MPISLIAAFPWELICKTAVHGDLTIGICYCLDAHAEASALTLRSTGMSYLDESVVHVHSGLQHHLGMRFVCASFQGNSQRQLEVHATDTFVQQADTTPPQDIYAQHSGPLQAIQTKQQCYVSVCVQPFRWVVWARCGTAASELKHLVDAHASPCTSRITIVGLPCEIRLWLLQHRPCLQV